MKADQGFADRTKDNLVDPRPDLRADSLLWQAVLMVAQEIDADFSDEQSLHGLLHGLRCGGARLYWLRGERLRLDYMPLVAAGWVEADLRRFWLEPAAKAIARVFSKVEKDQKHKAA